MRPTGPLVAAVMLVGTLAACGTDGPNDQLAAVQSAAAPVVATVRWNGQAFVPPRVELNSGSAIDLVNESPVTVRWVGDELDTGRQEAGATVRLAFDEVGTVELHPFDSDEPTLTVVVVDG